MPKLPISTQNGFTDIIELSYEQLQQIDLLPNKRKQIAVVKYGEAIEVVAVFIPNAFSGTTNAGITIGSTGATQSLCSSKTLTVPSSTYNVGGSYTAAVPKLLTYTTDTAINIYTGGDISSATSGKLIVGLRILGLPGLIND